MKKILVLDVPMIYDSRRRLLCNLCNKCPIWNHERCYCQYDFNMKAKGCPLKPMPQKKKGLELMDFIREADIDTGFRGGWNACIDAILEPNSANGETE